MRNLGFRILNLFIGGFFAPPDSGVRLGLLAVSGLAVPSWPMADAALSLVAGFLLLDLLHYLVDRLGHAVPFFCRIHALHHSDPDIDVTTTVRHHPIEILFSSTTYWLAVFVLDVPAFAALSHGLAVFITAAVQHGNVRLPERLERYLQPMLVTTDLHRLHHSVSFGLANSNYGAVLPFWDRLFRQYRCITRVQQEGIVFGVRELPRRDCLKPSVVFLTPWLIWWARAAHGPIENNPRRGPRSPRSKAARGRARRD